jgi:hypothetical protein
VIAANETAHKINALIAIQDSITQVEALSLSRIAH